MAIEWDRIGQLAFDRHVEALLHRMYDGKAIALNGRGGDQGIDVRVSTDAGLRIFQLKYHPDGFPGSHRGRRTAIKKSFLRAMQHDPVEWTLVVPCTLTASERAFVERLAVGRTVKVSVMDRPALDNGFAAHSSLEATFTRNQAREAARDFMREQVLLADGEDLSQRVRALGSRADNIDPDWTWDFARRGDTVIQTLRAQHALAHEASPVRVRLKTRPEAMDAGLAAAFTRSLGYGIAEEVELPPEAVASLAIDGPEWLSKTVSDVRVIWQPVLDAARSDAAAEIEFLGAEEMPNGRYAGRLIAQRSGELGASVESDIHGARLQMLVPFDRSAEGKMRYSFDLNGREPTEAVKVLRLYQRILRGGSFRITLDGTCIGSGKLPARGTDEENAEVEKLLSYLSDLEVVQRHCEAYFPAPLVYSGAERIDLRIARLLIEGRCVAYRSARTVTVTLNGSDSAALRAVLGHEPQCLRFSPPGFEVTVGGRTLDIGYVHLFHTRVTADNGPQAIAALRAGRAADMEVVFRPQDGEHFRLYLDGAPDDSRPLVPVPLGLPGYSDPR
ncbi:hypothetical protein [Streptomyces sp. NPDC091385]|uniref:hypothetical protein n=1 Tax=Streptomyces sp. NPDC091385 TaxID=3365997 RepID=UPI00381C41E8